MPKQPARSLKSICVSTHVVIFLASCVVALVGVIIGIMMTRSALADVSKLLLPVADGTFRQWKVANATSTSHFDAVNDPDCNGATDYVYTTSVGARDSYTVDVSSIPDGSVINQISITPCASKYGSGNKSASINLFYRFDGVQSTDKGHINLANGNPVVLPLISFGSLSLVKKSGSVLEIGSILSNAKAGLGAQLSQLTTQISFTPPAIPAAPTNLSASVSTSNVQLNWTDNSNNETWFRVERSTDQINFTEITTVGTNVTTYTDKSLPGGTYYYRIRAANTNGNSVYTNIATATVSVPPLVAAPTNLTATSTINNRVDLAWTDNSNNESAFLVERSTDGVNFVQLAILNPNSTSYINISLSNGTYYYRVRATSYVDGNSDYSNVASAMVATIVGPVPQAPTNLQGAASSTGVGLTWTDNSSNEATFRIERSTDGVAFAEIWNVGANVTSYTDSALINGTLTYYYRIRANNVNGGYSSYSNTVVVTMPATTALQAPSNLQVQMNWSRFSGYINYAYLTWSDNSASELGFKVETSTDMVNFVETNSVPQNSTDFASNSALTTGQYAYRVRAFDGAGNSAFSNIVTAIAAPLSLTRPAVNDTWLVNSSHVIQWRGGRVEWPVSIELRNSANTQTVTTIVANLTNLLDYQWTIPSSIAGGQYIVRVFCATCDLAAPGAFGDSPIFSIPGAPIPVGTVGNNSSLTVQRLFPGLYENTTYNIQPSDPEGIKNTIINKTNGSSVLGADPPCNTSLSSGAVTLLPSDFPLSGYVVDCQNPSTSYAVQANMPPL